jgi:2-polyprenyl-6-methoxyphenol hydroxylase-like FAD-dependent oxidoreductase
VIAVAGTRETDVVVVGAGPVGTTLGAVLADAGVRAVVLDARPFPELESSRATTVHAGTLEALDSRLDGLGARLADRGHWALRSVVWNGRRRIAEARWDQMPTRYAAMVNLPQADTEALLRSHLQACGGSVRWGWRATAIDQDEESVQARVATDEGPRVVAGQFLVGCDGARSEVRRSCGVALAGTTFPERFLLADVDLDTQLDRRSTHVFASTRGVLGVMPMPDGFRLNGTLTDEEELRADTLGDLMRARLGAAMSWVDLREVGWAAVYRTHSRVADTYRRGRAFLAGDAAHLNSPVGGQGMNVGVLDALDLGDRLVAVLAGRAADDVLDGYEATRRPIAERVLRTTRASTRMISARTPVERFVRDQLMRVVHRFPPVQRKLTLEPAGLT